MPHYSETGVYANGDQQFGFIIYGLWPGSNTPITHVDLAAVGLVRALTHDYILVGEDWDILLTECAFLEEADYWASVEAFEQCEDAFIKRGAYVAWIGSEGLLYADPPALFSAEEMPDGVIAAKTRSGLSFNGTTANGFVPLSAREMKTLQDVAKTAYAASTKTGEVVAPDMPRCE